MIIFELMKGGKFMNDKLGVLVDKDKKLKASFVLKTKGKDLSTAVREMLDKYAREYDKMQKNNS